MTPPGLRLAVLPALLLALPASAGEVPSAKGTVVAVSSAHPVAALSEALDKGLPAQEAAAQRFTRYMLSRSSDQAYVADAVKSDADAVKRLSALPLVWVKGKVAAKQGARVAMLYYVMGEDKALGAWAKPYPALEGLKDKETERARILAVNMKLFTADREGAVKENPSLSSRYTGPYKGGAGSGEWVSGFFDFASERAEAILNEPRVKSEIEASIKAHAPSAPVVPGTGTKKDRRGTAASGAEEGRARSKAEAYSAFDVGGCYERGGVTAYIPLDAKGQYRKISLKIYTVVEDGQPVNKLGIFDISEPGTPPDRLDARIFGQMFPLNQSGESVFRLDDRTADGAKYKLVIGKNGSISFSHPKKEENAVSTSINGLLEARKEQVQREGVVEKVNGITYRVIGQGGFRGGWLYFPSGDDGSLTGPAAGLIPTLAVETSQVGPDGRTERISGPRPLGFVGKSEEGKPQFMYLLWNTDAREGRGAFEPKTCEELKARCSFPPKPKKKDDKDKKGGKDKKDGGKDDGGKDDGGDGGSDGGGGKDDGDGKDGDSDDGSGGHDIEGDAPGFSKKCEIKAEQFPNNSMRETKLQGWTIFVSQQKDHGNYAQFCMNGAKSHMFNVSGIIARADVKAGDVIIETFTPESFIDPSLLQPGWSVVNNQIKSGSHRFKVTAHYVYYIPLANLAPAKFDAVQEKGTAPVDKVAREKLDVDVMNIDATKRINVYLRMAGSPDKASEAVEAALKRHAKTSPLYVEGKYKSKLLSYIKAEAGKARSKKINPDAYATIVLFLSGELGNTSAESGSTDNYKEIVPTLKLADGVDHPKLVYCGVSSNLETLPEHVSAGHVPK